MSMSPPLPRTSESSQFEAAATHGWEPPLRTAHRRNLKQRMAAALVGISVGLLAAVGVLAAIDYVWEWPWAVRLFALALSALAGCIWGERVWRGWIRPYQLSQAAADAEAAVSEFAHRLRTAHDYRQEPSTAPASPALLAALHRETTQISEQTDWNNVVDLKPIGLTVACGVFVVVALAFPLASSAEFRTAMGRALLVPWEYTTVTFSPHESTVRQGESVRIAARVEGRPVSSARLRIRPAGSDADWTDVELTADSETEAPREWTASLDDLQHDMEFMVLAGPRPLPPGYIHVKQPLKLQHAVVRVVPPEYTGRPPHEAETFDLKVLEGSQLEFRLTFNRPASRVRMQRVGNSQSQPATEHGPPAELPFVLSDANATAALADLRHSVTYRLEGTTDDGMSLEPVQVRIRVQLDRKPELRFVQPPEELTVLPTTEVPMVIEAEDDLGLHRAGILFQIGDGPVQTLWEADGGGTTDALQGAHTLMLEEHGLTFRDAITYWAFAEENYFGQPRRTTTPLRFIDIRPYKLEFQQQEGDGSCCQCSVTLEELIARQRQGLSRATAALEPPRTTGSLDPLAKAETELREQTDEFATGMAQRGADLPTVAEAVEQMQKAIEALQANRLEDAVKAEQQALASLVAAREVVRRKLNQSKSQSASACRKFDRDQRQKLRLPEKKQQDRQQKLAQARSQLEQLAKREQAWSQQASQCQNPSTGASQSKAQPQSPLKQQSPSQQQSGEQPPQSTDPQQSSQSPSETPQAGQQSQDSSSPEDLANRQRDILEELAELNQRLEELKSPGAAARQMQDNARESMQRGLEQLQQHRGEQAGQEGSRAAEQLRELSEHLGTMNSRDFGQRLHKARQQAQELAAREQALEDRLQQGPQPGDGSEAPQSGPSDAAGTARLAREQRSLATRMDALAELLDELQRNTDAERAGVRGRLNAATEENPPQEIAGQMREAADDLSREQPQSAREAAAHAQRQLAALSRDLEVVEREFAQPQLDELLELERKLAHVLQQMQRGRNSQRDAAEAARNWQELEARLQQLADGDPKLAEALQKFRAGPPPGTEGARRPPQPNSFVRPVQSDKAGETIPDGFYSWLELGDWTGAREVAKALQVKIQEAILAGAVQDSDEPVPAAYKRLVEQYYRTLSDDLR